MSQRCGITGRGHAVPAGVRSNTDPVFAWLNANDPNYAQYFNGYNQRHVLAPGEEFCDLMVNAAQQALQMAGLKPGDVDLLLGYASVSEFIMPNELARVHERLGLSERCWVLPVNTEYSNFNASLVFADALIRGGQAGNALVVCGGNWSRHVNYHVGAAASAADGAGAAVMQRTGDESTFRVVDFETLTQTAGAWGHMSMSSQRLGTPPLDVVSTPALGGALPDTGLFSQPYFHIDSTGMGEFKNFGVTGPVTVAQRLLQRNALPASQVTLICHQTSRYLLDQWNQQIGPHKLIETLSRFANMTVANIPLNLSFAYPQIETDHLVLLSIGTDLHSNAVLLRRNG